MKKIAVVGAGLSGLACALELKKNGHSVEVFEKTDRVGGRVKTDIKDGFKLDHGFQVFLDSYSLGEYFLDYSDLKFGKFAPGAKIKYQSGFQEISDPFRRPLGLLKVLFSPLASLKDKWLTLKLVLETKGVAKVRLQNASTLEYLRSYGFSDKYINSFFIPFFSGVFLERDLSTNMGFFRYLYGRFSTGSASLPMGGMEAVPKQMAAKIGPENIHLNQDITRLSSSALKFADGKELSFDAVVLATGKAIGSQLLGTSNPEEDEWNAVTTYYYETKSKDFSSKFLYLNTDSSSLVNHVACLTAAQASYAPKGKQLFSVNVLSKENQFDSENLNVRSSLEKLFGQTEVQKWNWLATYSVEKSLPTNCLYGAGSNENNGVFLAGDYLESPSIQGALLSGKNAAKSLEG